MEMTMIGAMKTAICMPTCSQLFSMEPFPMNLVLRGMVCLLYTAIWKKRKYSKPAVNTAYDSNINNVHLPVNTVGNISKNGKRSSTVKK